MTGIGASDIGRIWAPILMLSLTVDLFEYARRDSVRCVSQNRQRIN